MTIVWKCFFKLAKWQVSNSNIPHVFVIYKYSIQKNCHSSTWSRGYELWWTWFQSFPKELPPSFLWGMRIRDHNLGSRVAHCASLSTASRSFLKQKRWTNFTLIFLIQFWDVGFLFLGLLSLKPKILILTNIKTITYSTYPSTYNGLKIEKLIVVLKLNLQNIVKNIVKKCPFS